MTVEGDRAEEATLLKRPILWFIGRQPIIPHWASFQQPRQTRSSTRPMPSRY